MAARAHKSAGAGGKKKSPAVNTTTATLGPVPCSTGEEPSRGPSGWAAVALIGVILSGARHLPRRTTRPAQKGIAVSKRNALRSEHSAGTATHAHQPPAPSASKPIEEKRAPASPSRVGSLSSSSTEKGLLTLKPSPDHPKAQRQVGITSFLAYIFLATLLSLRSKKVFLRAAWTLFPSHLSFPPSGGNLHPFVFDPLGPSHLNRLDLSLPPSSDWNPRCTLVAVRE